MMEITNTLHSGMCRCCSSEGTFKDIKTKYHWMGEEEVYADMLTDCFDVKLCTPDDMENGICEVCITQLRNAVNFKKQVLHTEEQFKRRLQNKDVKNPIKLESVDEDPIESDHDHLSDADFSGTEYEVPIKEELEEKPKTKKRAAKATTSRAKKAKAEPESSKKRNRSGSVLLENLEDQHALKKKDKPIRDSMKHQENLKSILLYSNASIIRGKDNEGYGCNFCSKRYPKPSELKSHFLDQHSNINALRLPKLFEYSLKLDITDLKCKICLKNYSKLDDFTHHLRDDHEKNLFTDINGQIIPFKFDSTALRCAICETEFTNFKILLEHMHVHFRNFVCEVCNAGFVTKRLLVSHKRRHGNGNFKCAHCVKTFTCDQKKRDHEQRIHLGLKKRNKCKFCDEKFSDYWSKIDHLVEAHGVPRVVLKCQACERTFKNQRALTRHVKKDHLMERRHVCGICNMEFYLKNRLEDHMITHTGIKKFQCHVCSRWYNANKSLRHHLRSHADDRQFFCDICGQAFVQESNLASHMKTKHGQDT